MSSLDPPDGRVVSVAFPSVEQQQLLDDVRAQGITVKVAKVQHPQHKLRYIVGDVVIVLGIAIWLLMRRRRTREEELGPGISARVS